MKALIFGSRVRPSKDKRYGTLMGVRYVPVYGGGVEAQGFSFECIPEICDEMGKPGFVCELEFMGRQFGKSAMVESVVNGVFLGQLGKDFKLEVSSMGLKASEVGRANGSASSPSGGELAAR